MTEANMLAQIKYLSTELISDIYSMHTLKGLPGLRFSHGMEL